jgi:hypothetical protein
LHKKKGLKLGIIAVCILIPFLVSYAENNNRDVKQIQTLLTLLKFKPGPIDGILGSKTIKAIRAFQMDIGVPVTGKIDENLKSQLDGAYKLIVIHTRKQNQDDEEKPQIVKERPKVNSTLPAAQQQKELETDKEPEVKQPKEIATAPQKELTSQDHDLKTENQYFKYIKIGFPIIAVIFLAFFYRIWTRSHEKEREGKGPKKAKPEVGRTKIIKPEVRRTIIAKPEVRRAIIAKPEVARTIIAKPEDNYEELAEVQELEKEIPDNALGKAELARQDPIDYQDPSHPGYIPPVVRRKVWIRNKGQCAACSSREDLQYDYIVPLLEGGHNTLNNLQLLCKSCNQEKSDK